MLRIDAGKSSNVSLALACHNADMLLKEVGEFFHELAAGSRRHLGYPRSASGTRYIIFGPTRLAGPLLLILSSWPRANPSPSVLRSEEHTSELQSQSNLVCRLLLEKKIY